MSVSISTPQCPYTKLPLALRRSTRRAVYDAARRSSGPQPARAARQRMRVAPRAARIR